MRFLAALPLLVSCTPAAPSDAQPDAQPDAQSARTSIVATRTDLVEALEVLHSWDAQRARAWARADPDALRALYARGSAAGRADVQLLRAYRARGLVVRRLVTQVFAVRVLRSNDSSLRLRVFDRVAGGEVLDHGDPEQGNPEQGSAAPLRSSRPVTRTIVFRLDGATWRVGEISGSGRGPRAARP
jgi:hypothetical protein